MVSLGTVCDDEVVVVVEVVVLSGLAYVKSGVSLLSCKFSKTVSLVRCLMCLQNKVRTRREKRKKNPRKAHAAKRFIPALYKTLQTPTPPNHRAEASHSACCCPRLSGLLAYENPATEESKRDLAFCTTPGRQ